MQSIGFIGLGNMGGNMAARYLAAGYTVYGEDRDREHAQWLVDQGLRWAATPRALAETARRRPDLPAERRHRRVGRLGPRRHRFRARAPGRSGPI